MAYTVIEVERITGVPSRRLRFWLSKGLFPYVDRDANNVAYFSQKDVEWVKWINYLRRSEMTIEDIRKYVHLAHKGNTTAKERQEMLYKQRERVSHKIEELHAVIEKLDYKLDLYDKLIAQGVDAMNPQSKEYISCKEVQKIKKKEKTAEQIASNLRQTRLKEEQ